METRAMVGQIEETKEYINTQLNESRFDHRDRSKHPLFFVFNFFSSFEHVKSLLIMGPSNTKNSSLKCDFLIINNE